jgi:hypothetical protein
MLLKRRAFKVFMPGVVVLGLLGFNLYVYSSLVDGLVIEERVIDSGNALVLDEDYSYYVNKESGSPCFSKPLCQLAFDGLNYYESSANIYKLITKADPDLIIDEINVVPRLFIRFPLLEKEYQKKGVNTYIKISN